MKKEITSFNKKHRRKLIGYTIYDIETVFSDIDETTNAVMDLILGDCRRYTNTLQSKYITNNIYYFLITPDADLCEKTINLLVIQVQNPGCI